MALLTPSLPERLIMDASQDSVVSFKTSGYMRHTGCKVRILDINTGESVYTNSDYSNSTNKFTIPASSVANGKEYILIVQLVKGEDKEVSNWSEDCLLCCYSAPVCTIDNIGSADGESIVQNQNYTFEGTYYQADGVKIQSYYYVLYDNNNKVLQVYDKYYLRNASSSEICVQKIEGLEANKVYYIELICIDNYSKENVSERYRFTVRYDMPRFTQFVEISNEEETASVKMEASMIQILFDTDKDPVFINKQELDLRDNRAYNRIYSNGTTRLNISGDFTLKLYCREVPRTEPGIESYFLTLTSDDKSTKIQMKEMDGRIHVYKTITFQNSDFPMKSHYMSDEISGYKVGDKIIIQINHTNGRLDVYAQKI